MSGWDLSLRHVGHYLSNARFVFSLHNPMVGTNMSRPLPKLKAMDFLVHVGCTGLYGRGLGRKRSKLRLVVTAGAQDST